MRLAFGMGEGDVDRVSRVPPSRHRDPHHARPVRERHLPAPARTRALISSSTLIPLTTQTG
eukprot:scaffold9678_cov79-Cyclotella_meneghiniana.AAC.2